MDSAKPGLDLEKELTCSICTELLYQPLTLLDCLHTYCGACLKDWFSYQALTAESSPTPPAPDTNIFTCPSCRAPVRDTRHNATVATLLDMFLTANPEKGRSERDKIEMSGKYNPGDRVIPKLKIADKTAEELLAEDEDRRLINQVTDLSLREVGIETSSAQRQRRRREDGGSLESRARRRRETSQDSRNSRRNDVARGPRLADEGRQQNDQLQPDGRTHAERRQRRSESRRRSDEYSDVRRRQVEHQSSLRSLISSGDLSERDIEREIEEFARQIQEEGLLDGLDLDNIDLSRNDELSRRITEAYRRRQRERSRNEAARRSNASPSSRPSSDAAHESRPRAPDGRRATSGQRPHSRSTSATRQADDRSRPPPSASSLHPDVRSEEGRRRRRTASGGRSSTTPVVSSQPETRPATRSQTDLALRDPEQPSHRAAFMEGRSSSTPTVPTTVHSPEQSPATQDQSFATRVSDPSALVSAATVHNSADSAVPRARGPKRPLDLAIVSQTVPNPLGISSPTSPGHHRTRSQLYHEPSISCSRCSKAHIEYELHYNCATCSGGNWNICLDCYRAGKGCLHWFGFGYGAWNKWEKARQAGSENLARPHMLTANRYLPPKIIPGGAEGRRTLTTDDPLKRLESGNFCARCQTWANECYWRCDICNQGDWGFCNQCVNQGKSCTHPLLPLTYQPPSSHTPPASPRSPVPPTTASILTGPSVASIGPFKPLTFRTRCDVCQDPIAPSQSRYHCFSCTSSIEQDTKPGDYDICMKCYASLVANGQISPENGHGGWRRCPNGHRMIIVGFQDGTGGQFRYVVADLVGGRNLKAEPYDMPSQPNAGLQKWCWPRGEQKLERLVTKEVQSSAPTQDGSKIFTQTFPPDGGVGMTASANWAWYPKAEDELLFPKGAEIREIEDVNGDWFFGVYMGAKGLLPSPYVRTLRADTGN